jgi:hypothetical protein
MGLFLLRVKEPGHCDARAECADAMNFNWLKSHSAPLHRLRRAHGLERGHLLCHFELTSVCEERSQLIESLD